MTHRSIRVEPIDNRHPSWTQVLSCIFRTGNQDTLMLNEDGWLSSRQTVLAAFDGSDVVGHLCFRVEPVPSDLGRPVVRSKVDSFSIQQEYSDQQVEDLLLQTAQQRAQLMQCSPPRMGLVAC